jgi:hypothetical protein
MEVDVENSVGVVEAICALVGAVAAILGGVWLIVRQAFKSGVNARRLEEIEKSIGGLPCVLHGDDILKVKSILMQRYPISASIFSMKSSPRVLNERGRQLFNDIGGANFLEENREALFRRIAESRPLAALDVE